MRELKLIQLLSIAFFNTRISTELALFDIKKKKKKLDANIQMFLFKNMLKILIDILVENGSFLRTANVLSPQKT